MSSQPSEPHHHFRLPHPPRYYAHRVKESFTTRVLKILCSCFLGLVIAIGVLIFVLWLSLRPHRPRFHITNFSIPSISGENGLQNAEISFNVTDRNPNENVGIFYMNMHASVYYREKKIGMTPLNAPFYQPPKNTTFINGVFSGASLKVGGDSWEQFMVDKEAGKIVFRLTLNARFRFKLTVWDGKRHRMHVSCDVAVGPDGEVLAISKKKRCSIYFT